MTTEWKRPYTFSRDYDLLVKLLDEGNEIICYADYTRYDKTITRDICIARKMNDNHYTVCCRGVCYTDWYDWHKHTPQQAFEDVNVEFIIPNKNEV